MRAFIAKICSSIIYQYKFSLYNKIISDSKHSYDMGSKILIVNQIMKHCIALLHYYSF